MWYGACEVPPRACGNSTRPWIHHSWFVRLPTGAPHTSSLRRLALPRPIYQQNIYARNLGIILGVMGFVLIFILLGLVFCYQKSRQSGHYKTKEDQGANQAVDADTAIIKGDPRHPDLTEAKEWFF